MCESFIGDQTKGDLVYHKLLSVLLFMSNERVTSTAMLRPNSPYIDHRQSCISRL